MKRSLPLLALLFALSGLHPPVAGAAGTPPLRGRVMDYSISPHRPVAGLAVSRLVPSLEPLHRYLRDSGLDDADARSRAAAIDAFVLGVSTRRRVLRAALGGPADLQAWLDVCLDEVVGRFSGKTARRDACTQRLMHLVDLARRTGQLQRLIVFGSYVTAKPEPNDVDLILVMTDAFLWICCVGICTDSRFGTHVRWRKADD